MSSTEVLGRVSGPVVVIGFGSIGRGVLPLLDRHIEFDRSRCTVIDPDDRERRLLEEYGVGYMRERITQDNHRTLLPPLLSAGQGQGFCVNLSVDTSSLDIMRLCRELGVLYLDTVVEPWPGFYYDADRDNATRTNYALRATVMEERRRVPGGTTAVSCCGANPGMVSWFVKEALVRLARDLGHDASAPGTGDRQGWAHFMRELGVKGVHIAERDTQRAQHPKPVDVFWNTWSVDGFISEGLQPAELGWGTHERWMPANGRTFDDPGAALVLTDPVRTEPQPVLTLGVVADDDRRPLRASGDVCFHNVFAAGAVCAGNTTASLGLGTAAADGWRAGERAAKLPL